MGCPHAQRQSDEFFCPRCNLRWPYAEGSDCRAQDTASADQRGQLAFVLVFPRQKTTKVLERATRSLTGQPFF